MKITCGMVLVSLSIFGAAIHAQSPGRSAPKVETFTPRADGTWRTIVTAPDGQQTEFVYEPNSNFIPSLSSSFELINAPEARIRYTYHVTNDPKSLQGIVMLHVGPDMPVVQIVQAPFGWDTDSNPGWLMAYGRGDPPTTISPGQSEILVVDGTGLPGVTILNAEGDAPPISVPDGLSRKQSQELAQLSSSHLGLDRPVIGPTIPFGNSDLPPQVLLARVRGHYAEALMKYRHPYAREILAVFDDVFDDAFSDRKLQSALARVKALTRRRVTDPWHQQMSNALGICVDVMANDSRPIQ